MEAEPAIVSDLTLGEFGGKLGGYSTNSSGNISLAAGENFDISPETMSTGWLVIRKCQ